MIIDSETGEVLTPPSEFDPDSKVALALIHDARTAIEQSRNIFDVKNILSVSKAAAAFYAAQGMEENAQVAREASLWAQRRAGEMLKEMPKNTGALLDGRDGDGNFRQLQDATTETVPTLSDLDIEKTESYRWQLLADVPEDKFQGYIDEKLAKGYELTTGGLVKIGKMCRARDKADGLELPSDKYRVIYADPPWKYSDTLIDGYGPAEFHYPSMSIAELCELPVWDMAAEDAVLFLWVTSPMLEDAFKVIRAWGFEYKSSFVWDKVKHNYGHYNSVRHEFLLVCTRGSCTPDTPELFDSVQSIERTEHSAKPEEFRRIIDTLYTSGKRIELFARKATDGWDVWGNEAR